MTGREWREASDMRSSLVTIGLVAGAGALLRFWNVNQGGVSPAELQVLGPVVQLVHTGAYRPVALTQPTLPIYFYTLVASLHFMWGAISGVFRSVADFGVAQAVAWERPTSALLGTAVVFVVYQIGMRWGARHALLGAGLMAVTPTHVVASRAVGEGAMLSLFAALALLFSLVAIERRQRPPFIVAGAVSGLAAACHYAGALTLVMPLVAVWMTRTEEHSRIGRGVIVLVAAVAAFLVATPLAVADLPAFLNGFAAMASPTSAPLYGVDRIDVLPWLVGAMQWPALLLTSAGLTLGIVRAITGPGHTRWTLLVSFPVVYFTLVAWHGATSQAALLPLLAPAVLLAAIAVVSGVSQLRRFDIPRPARTALIAALTVAAVLPPAVLSVILVRQATRASIAAELARPDQIHRPGR